jgi:hypothetical protein
MSIEPIVNNKIDSCKYKSIRVEFVPIKPMISSETNQNFNQNNETESEVIIVKSSTKRLVSSLSSFSITENEKKCRIDETKFDELEICATSSQIITQEIYKDYNISSIRR